MEKYRSVIPDFEAFKQECGKEPISTIRRNDLKSGEDFEDRLAGDFDFEKASWNDRIYRLKNEKKPGKSMLHWRGEYYVQEESAAVPVDVLDPRPGEKVLDMCAAPGGKTTQIADRMDNKGLVVANEKSGQRMKSLHANIYRTGAFSVNALNKDGRRIPEDRSFDRVLVDAPCSGEGNNCRREEEERASEQESKDLARLQLDLLEKAFSLVKNDGVVVYSTCTFSPIENENVVSEALKNNAVELERIELGFRHDRGLESFQNLEFGEEMGKTVRIYPHHLQSGGMYVARFKC
ncbi:MAG: RsmB/NOP family class I SAM-dependent RNA methyltransferase [Candidatus Nanohaloarchaea archaeon]